MSEIIRSISNAGRLADIIATDSGSYFMISSVKLPSWYETCMFPCDPSGYTDYMEAYKREYKTYKAMESGHNNICQYAEMFIE